MSIKHYQESSPVYSPNTFPIVYIAVLFVLAYSVFLVVRSVMSGVDQTKTLANAQAQIDQLKLQVEVTQRFISYQQTPNYIEKQAREHFAYMKPGEVVVDVPENIDQSQALADEQAGRNAAVADHIEAPHLQAWWNYFFGSR